MRVTGALTATMVLALGVSACGASRAPVYSPDAVDQPARLEGCTAGERAAGPRVEVRLSMVVNEEGRVESARPVRSSGPRSPDNSGPYVRTSRALVQVAREMAMSCVYRPARLNGVAVRSRVERTFAFQYTPDYDTPPMGGGGSDGIAGGPLLQGSL